MQRGGRTTIAVVNIPKRNHAATSTIIAVLLCLAVIVGMWIWRMGAVEVPADAPQLADEVHAVMRDRLLAATVIGLALGAAGVLLRTATHNPLAPGDYRREFGRSFGAVVGTTVTGSVSGAAVLPGALAGAGLAALITVGIGLRANSADPTGAAAVQRMILLGIAISALFSALTAVTLVIDEAQLSTVLSWLSGRLGGVRLSDLVPSLIAVAVVWPLMWVSGRGLDTRRR